LFEAITAGERRSDDAAQVSMSRIGKRDSGPRQRPLIGWLWHAAAGLSGLLILFVLSWTAERLGMPLILFGGTLGLVFWIPLLLYNRGQRHFVREAEEIISADQRAPVVYLRSFAAEIEISEEERALATILQTVGPFVAVGAPGDSLPPPGASRFYQVGANWQEFVTNLVRSARLVVILTGSTPGLAWELSLCRSVLSPSQLIMLVPKDDSSYAKFAETARSAGFELPPHPGLPDWHIYIPGRLLAIISFESDWRPALRLRQYMALDATSRLDETTVSLRLDLNEVLETRGIPLPSDQHRYAEFLHRHWRAGVIIGVALAFYGFVRLL
jgi:hypothetical protein